ncbi:hypothetical protein GIB67_015691 [Kingdonia uniflora]|uniref:Uncharacterized protein n=1 Tax=Kingdonia uniflora TaxID=39325 RepID=A0A7J7NUA2_9MAGN|nr:hypothetical protein GIB67_015691 [Kingdonia uniflora]
MKPIPAEDTEVFGFLIDEKEAGLKGEVSYGDRSDFDWEGDAPYGFCPGCVGSGMRMLSQFAEVGSVRRLGMLVGFMESFEVDISVDLRGHLFEYLEFVEDEEGEIGDVDGCRVECVVNIQHCAPRFGLERDDARRVGL